MKNAKHIIAIAVTTLISGVAFAQTNGAQVVQRDINQQKRIEQGLQSGQLTVKEAGSLERQEAHIDRLEARDLSKGPLTAKESAQINRLENKVSNNIYADKHNGRVGNPTSVSSTRMQRDVQRNVNQEQRIENGINQGQLNNGQVASLERGQAHVDRVEANAARNGHISKHEQHHIQHTENVQSGHIHRARTGE
jgi:hypothetical protein